MTFLNIQFRQVKALYKKNKLIKQRNRLDTLFEFFFTLTLCLIILLINLYLKYSSEPNELTLPFYKFNFVLTAAIPILVANTSRFILFQVVKEKQINVLNTLITLNLQSRAYGLSYFVCQQVNVLYTAVFLTIANIPLIDSFSKIVLFLVIIVIFDEAMIFFSLTFSTLFGDPKFSTQIGLLMLFLPVALFIVINHYCFEYQATIIYAFGWIPHFPSLMLLQYYLDAYWQLENRVLSIDEAGLIIMLIANIPLYIVAYLYLDGIITNQLPIFHCCTLRRKRQRIEKASVQYLKKPMYSRSFKLLDPSCQEADETNTYTRSEDNTVEAVKIMSLRKSYDSQVIIKDFNLTIYQNEVVCLLGNNGSGKTTLINMLVGLTKPDSGEALIYGNRLSTELYSCRNNIRLCQQFDFLFKDLTPREHLELICQMKEISEELINTEIEKILDMVMLKKDQNTMVKYLSGGQKRKLSLGMALIGDSKFIILDEPTTSLDHVSQKQIWNIIMNISQGRTILITTQLIEEADTIAHKICILKNGDILKYDTPDNLKREHSYGFKLEVSPQTCEFEQYFAEKRATMAELITKELPESYEVFPQPLNKLSIMIPYRQQVKLPEILEQLRHRYPQFYPDIYMNSLEDAYLHIYNSNIEEFLQEVNNQSRKVLGTQGDENVNENISNNFKIQIQTKNSKLMSVNMIDFKKTTFWSQVWIMIKLRMLIFKKSPRMWMFILSLFLPRLIIDIVITYLYQNDNIDIESRILLLRMITFIFSLNAGVFIYVQIDDYQTNKRNLFKLLGLNGKTYYLGYFITDFILYIIPIMLIVIACYIMDSDLFVPTSIIKSMSFTSFGFAIIPLTYLFCFAFDDLDDAFRNSGIVIYTFGFMVADAINSMTMTQFYQEIHPFNSYKLCTMIDPFIYQYWSNGFPDQNEITDEFKFYTQIGFGILNILLGLFLFLWVLFLDKLIFIRIQQGENPNDVNPLLLKKSMTQMLAPKLDHCELPYHQFTEQTQHEHARQVSTHTVDFSSLNQSHLGHSNTTPVFINVRNLSKTYHNNKVAVKDCGFELKQGKILGILGPNGAGKSTIFNILSMITARTHGSIMIMDEDISMIKSNKNQQKFGIVSQSNILWESLTVDEHLELIASIEGIQNKEKVIDEIKQVLMLSDFSKKKSKFLSGGNKRKLCTAMALLSQPQIILLDEPTTGLDPISRRNLFNYLRSLVGSSILIITQNIEEAEGICDQVALMVNGEFKQIGTPNYIKETHERSYILQVELWNADIKERINQEIQNKLKFCKRIEGHDDDNAIKKYLKYDFSSILKYYNSSESDDIRPKIAHMFIEIINMLELKIIKDFSIHRSSLESVIDHIAKDNPSFIIHTTN